MKALLLILITLGFTAWGQETPDENPGHLDNPAALALIKQVLTDNKQDLTTFTITYLETSMTQDKHGASNSYIIRDTKTGKAMKVTVAVLFQPVTQAFAMPTHHLLV